MDGRAQRNGVEIVLVEQDWGMSAIVVDCCGRTFVTVSKSIVGTVDGDRFIAETLRQLSEPHAVPA